MGRNRIRKDRTSFPVDGIGATCTSEHRWVETGPGIGLRSKLPGTWFRCAGCNKSVHIPDGFTEFQEKCVVAMSWIDDVSFYEREGLLTEREIDSYASFPPMDPCPKCKRPYDRPVKGIALHGLLSRDCKLAQKFAVALWAECQDRPGLLERAALRNVAVLSCESPGV